MTVACRVCGKPTTKRGFLYVCQASKCSAAHWDKRAVLKNNLEDDAVLERVLSDASVPEYLQAKKSHYVYVLRLRGEQKGLSEENGFSRIIDTITVGSMKNQNPFRYFKTSPEIIRLAVMMYVRFPLSLRNVEDLLHERGIDICHETVRYWWNRFGPMFASEIRRTRVSRLECYSNWQWHIDEVFVRINGEQHYLWRAVDHEGEVLETYVTKRRDKAAALAFLKKAMKRYGEPKVIVTDRLASYKAALREINSSQKQEVGRWMNNRAENSHLPFRRRERAMQRFRRMRSLQKFVALHSSVYNLFNHERHLTKRNDFKDQRQAALSEWQQLCAA